MSSLSAVLTTQASSYAAQAGNWSFGLGGLPAFGFSLDHRILEIFAVHLAVSELASGKHTLH